MKNFQFLFLAILMTGLGSCVKKGGLQEGTWRGELALAGDRRAPFLFEVKKQGTDSVTFTLINGEERVELPGAAFHGDTLIVPIVAYDAVLKGFVTDNRIEGKFIKNYIEDDPGVPFTAVYGVTERFAPVAQPTTRKVDGKWDVLFVGESETHRHVGISKRRRHVPAPY